MTQEEKDLLLKDLCARLPYGVHLFTNSKHHIRLLTISRDLDYDEQYWINGLYDIDEVKPYLRPMSSMTEEESAKLSNIISEWFDKELFYLTEEPFLEYALSRINYSINPLLFDWLNAHHFDYRGLIPMGIALEAPEGMYDIE